MPRVPCASDWLAPAARAGRAVAARPLRRMRCSDQLALPRKRTPDLCAVRRLRVALRRGARRVVRDGFVGHAGGAGLDRLRVHPVARRADAAARVGRAAGQSV
ncbi:hypothetical protein G6F57_019627 [Rhizopus arrhizus]|nr:hypothetical protein G6F57_019627 [Rhizopus arrhizus]